MDMLYSSTTPSNKTYPLFNNTCLHSLPSSPQCTGDVRECQYSAGEMSAADTLTHFNKYAISSQQIKPSLVTGASVSSVDLTDTVTILKQEISKKDTECKLFQDQLQQATKLLASHKKALEKCFTASQVKCLLTGKPITKWEEEDIISALTLRRLDTKTYKYLREHMEIPLPCISTLDKWVSQINIEPGLLRSVLRIMHVRGSSLTAGEKACILCFDEMKVERKYSFDKGADKIYKPHNYVQVIMAQGIACNWKQPVFYDYDTKMTKELLLSVISSLESVGFPVHATVCDMSGANRGLLNSLGISSTSSSFVNPSNPHRKIHVFVDPPHLLKLIRNNIIDHGILTPFGLVNAAPLLEFVNYQSGDFKFAPKVSETNIIVKGPQRQKVKTATHLLSETVAKSLEYLGKQNALQSPNWEETSKLINLVDTWFDIFNSSSITGDKPKRSPFEASTHQVNNLKSIIEVFQNSKVSGKRVYPFINGILISSRSLQNLFVDMKHLYAFRFLLTRRLNQDVLEQTFGILRQMGSGHDHPDPVSLKYRMRRYILCRKHVLVSLNPNTDIIGNDSFMAEGIKQFSELSSPIRKPCGETLFKLNDRSTNKNTFTMCVEDTDADIVLDDARFTVPNEEIDGFKYVLGCVANKFKNKYAFLCSLEKENDWITYLDRGGLKRMNKDIADQFKKMEEIFRSRHKDDLLEECQAVNGLTSLAKFVVEDIPVEVIGEFFRRRIYFRIKMLNNELALDSGRKESKKMKKIVD